MFNLNFKEFFTLFLKGNSESFQIVNSQFFNGIIIPLFGFFNLSTTLNFFNKLSCLFVMISTGSSYSRITVL